MNILFFFALMAASLISAQETDLPNPQNLRLDQVDTTDSLAIPLDSSDVEDQIEIEEMHEEQKEYFKKHPEAYKEWLKTHPNAKKGN